MNKISRYIFRVLLILQPSPRPSTFSTQDKKLLLPKVLRVKRLLECVGSVSLRKIRLHTEVFFHDFYFPYHHEIYLAPFQTSQKSNSFQECEKYGGKPQLFYQT